MKTKTPKIKRARITSVSVSRLYNLGNYQNVKYDLTAEVPEGASAKDTLCQLVAVLGRLKPLRKPGCCLELERAEAKLESDLSEYEKSHFDSWREEVQKFAAAKLAREEAVKSLDALGGTSIAKDAKKTWQDDDEEF